MNQASSDNQGFSAKWDISKEENEYFRAAYSKFLTSKGLYSWEASVEGCLIDGRLSGFTFHSMAPDGECTSGNIQRTSLESLSHAFGSFLAEEYGNWKYRGATHKP